MKGQRIGLGRTAEILAWGKDRVLKLFWEGWPASSVEREARVSRTVVEAGLPVPAIEGVIEVDGRYGIIYERVEGSSMLSHLILEPAALSRYATMLAELHSEMHRHRVPELPSQRSELERKIRGATSLPEDSKEAVLRVLGQLPGGGVLCHGDFHPDNILMSPRGPIVIDWNDATRGNPLADVARTSLLLRIGEPPPGTPNLELIQSLRRRFHSAYLERYLQLMGGSADEVELWLLPNAAARLSEKISGEEDQLMAIIQRPLPS